MSIASTLLSVAQRVLAALIALLRRAVDAVLSAWRSRGMAPDLDAVWSVSVWWDRMVERAGVDDRLAVALRSKVAELRAAFEDEVEAASVASGRSADAVAAAVQAAADRVERRWRVWVEAVSRTEATRMAAERQLASAEARRVGARKRWVAMPDDRVRHSHDLADGDVVSVMSPFLVGGWPMMYPGDPAGPPRETVNCRCRLEIINA